MAANFPRPDGRPETLDEMRRLLREDETRSRELVGDVPMPYPPPDDPTVPTTGGEVSRDGRGGLRATDLHITGRGPTAVSAPIGRPQDDATEEDLSYLVAPLEKASAEPEVPPIPEWLAPPETASASPSGPRDFAPEFADAERAGDDSRLAARLVTAGSMFNRALTGADDVAKFQKLEGDADREVAAALARVKAKQATEKDRQLLDRWLAEQETKRQQFASTQAGTQARLAEQIAGNAARDRDAAARRDLDERRLAETERHNRAVENRPASSGRGGASYLETQNENIRERNVDLTMLPKLGVTADKFAGSHQAIKTIESLAPNLTFGVVPPDYQMGDWERVKSATQFGKRFNEAEATQIRTAVQRLIALIRHQTFGAALTEHEQANANDMFSESLMAGPEAQAAALQIFRQELGRRILTSQAHVAMAAPEKFKKWAAMTGVSFLDPVYRDVVPADVLQELGADEGGPSAAPTTPAPEPRPGDYDLSMSPEQLAEANGVSVEEATAAQDSLRNGREAKAAENKSLPSTPAPGPEWRPFRSKSTGKLGWYNTATREKRMDP